jgi:hypothetical protein
MSSTLINSSDFFIAFSNDLFVELAKACTFSLSDSNVFITSNLSFKEDREDNFKPTYFQIPYIYSAADNLTNGNFKKSVTIEGNTIITTYYIPYKVSNILNDKIVVYVVYFNTDTQTIFFEIPREFTFNSKESSSTALTINGENTQGIFLIPKSFTNALAKPGDMYSINISISSIEKENTNAFRLSNIKVSSN